MLIAGLAGCASVQLPDYRAALPARVRTHTELGGVPFHPQEDYPCGPAALATALTYAGAMRSPQEKQDEPGKCRKRAALLLLPALVARGGDPGPGQVLAQVLDGVAVQRAAVVRPVQDAFGAIQKHADACAW